MGEDRYFKNLASAAENLTGQFVIIIKAGASSLWHHQLDRAEGGVFKGVVLLILTLSLLCH